MFEAEVFAFPLGARVPFAAKLGKLMDLLAPTFRNQRV